MAYTREQKAGALALVSQGLSAEKAANKLGINPRSVQIWAKRLREISPKETPDDIRNEDLKLIRRSQELINDAYDDIEESSTATKHLIALNAIKGTAQDKENVRQGKGVTVPISITFITKPRHETAVEPEYREVPPERLSEPAGE